MFFGEEAKDSFWNLYKSERKFKDYDELSDEIHDPRFAYLKTCKDLKVNPKARMIIRDQKTTCFDFSNYSLLNKSALAVGEAIKRYTLPIEQVKLVNNGLRSKDCILLIDSLQRHYVKLSVLNLAKNRLGCEGAKHLASAIQ